jgi:hypothetical protein
MLAAALVAVAASVPAEAHGRARVRVGVVFAGPGLWYHHHPAYYYPPYYYYPRPVVVRAEPTVYIERGDGYAPAGQSQDYWYYCAESKAYHPYVKHCPGGWQKHVPTPPPGE